MMILLGSVSALFVFAAVVLTLLRISFDLRFSAIQKEPDQTPLFRRKVKYLRKVEQAKHIRYLLVTCLSVGIALMVLLSAFYFLAKDQQTMARQTNKLTERIDYLEQEQKQLIASLPLKNYPAEGVGLKDYAWEKLSDETKDAKLQNQIETAIYQRTIQYFGSTDTSVSLSDPHTLTLQLNGQMADSASQETIKKNIDGFVNEAEAISGLTDIQVRMITSDSKNKKVVYHVNYAREKSSDSFNKTNVSEQNLKNDGGKG